MTELPLLDVDRWADKVRVATQKRNEAIRAARAKGHTLRHIAVAAHLSVEAVRKIAQSASL